MSIVIFVHRFFGTKKLEPSERIIYEKDGQKHALVIKSAELKEAGSYTVKAINVAGTMSATAKLKVKGV